MRSLPIYGLLFAAALLHAQTTGDTQPSIVVRNDPEYSGEATRARVQSMVLLNIIVGEDGKAHDIRVAQGAGFGLDEKAVQAMGTWVFRPGTKDGKPAPMPANVEMNFHLQVRNDTEDHTGQFARMNFSLAKGATRPELIIGKLPGNPVTGGDQALRIHLQVGVDGVPKDVTVLGSTDKVWEQQALRVIRGWHFSPASLDGATIPADGIFELAHSAPPEATPVIVELDESEPAPRRAPVALQVAGLLPRSQHTATLLGNGTVLLAGGAAHQSEEPPGSADFHSLASAQIFDWATRRIANTGDMLAARAGHTATLLRDGTVLIAGGHDTQPLATTEIFDPSTGKFSPSGNLHEARDKHVAVALPDGRVLICGGIGGNNKYLSSAEIYNPRTKTFSATGAMTLPRSSFSGVSLKDRRVFVFGGFGVAGGTAEIYDPAQGSFRAAGKLITPRYGFSASLLDSGKILIAGGATDSNGGEALATAELFDPATGSSQPTGSMAAAREFQVALALGDGRILLSGGIPGLPGSPLTATEIYDPGSGAFTPGPTLTGLHTGHTATLLQDGTVLVAGSGLIGAGSSAELVTVK